MAERTIPYGPFNFLVTIDGGRGAEEPLGGFAEVSGLTTELTIQEYRSGNDRVNHVTKSAGIHKVGDVTLKRGVVNSTDLWGWIELSRRGGPAARRNVVITLLDESRKAVQTWRLFGCLPMKYTGPTLNAKGGTDVAMEELVLASEDMEIAALV